MAKHPKNLDRGESQPPEVPTDLTPEADLAEAPVSEADPRVADLEARLHPPPAPTASRLLRGIEHYLERAPDAPPLALSAKDRTDLLRLNVDLREAQKKTEHLLGQVSQQIAAASKGFRMLRAERVNGPGGIIHLPKGHIYRQREMGEHWYKQVFAQLERDPTCFEPVED